VLRLEMAIALNPKKHDALWCLGNALTSQGFLYADVGRASAFFEKARACFQRALDEEPRNETYKKALEMTQKAPYLHQVSLLGDAESSLGDAKSSLGDAESSLGDAK
jgi:tetratricopeptide (TPR) repeat protein